MSHIAPTRRPSTVSLLLEQAIFVAPGYSSPILMRKPEALETLYAQCGGTDGKGTPLFQDFRCAPLLCPSATRRALLWGRPGGTSLRVWGFSSQCRRAIPAPARISCALCS